MDDKTTTFRDLAGKGDGVLTKRGDVWTYPNAPTDRSGTNLKLPAEFVSNAEVQRAIADGDLVVVTTAPGGAAVSVRLKPDGDAPAAINVVQAGAPEAGTELPDGSRPEHDAGMRALTQEEIDRAAAAATKTLRPEGAERRRAGDPAPTDPVKPVADKKIA